MKLTCVFLLLLSASNHVLSAAAPFEDVATDPQREIQCRMTLITNRISHCASGVSVVLTNISATQTYHFETYGSTVVISVYEAGSPFSRPASKHRKNYSDRDPPDSSQASILPGHTMTWNIDFDDVIDRSSVTNNILSNCFVIAHTVIAPFPVPAKSLETYKTNVCISLSQKQ